MMIWSMTIFLLLNYLIASTATDETVSVGQSSGNHPHHHHHHHHHDRHIIQSELQMLKSITDSVSKFKEFDIPNVSNTSLINILDDLNEKNTRFFMIKVSELQLVDTPLFSNLDSVMTSRLWFSIRRLSVVSSPGSTPSLDFILIERVPDHVNEPLRMIAEKNFPGAQAQCKEHPISATLLMGTWGNDARNIVSFLNAHTQYVTYFFSSHTGSVHDATSFNSEGECLDKVNKYECLFLPSTSCELPKELAELSLRPVKGHYMYDQADSQGKLLDSHKIHEYNVGIFKMKKRFDIVPVGLTSTHDFYAINGNYSYYFTGRAPDIILNDTVNYKNLKVEGVYSTAINLFGYSLRVNSAFRMKIQYYVDHFRATSQPPFYHNTSCVWLHARKDDRMLPPTEWDMLEFCKNFTHYNTEKHIYELIPGKFKKFKNDTNFIDLRSGTLQNYGCTRSLPYGAATLEHFINASLVMSPHTKNLFLSTDDGAWFTEAISKYRSQPNNLIDKLQLQINHFEPPSTHRQVHSMDNAAILFATMELGQQCEGFVGYPSGSAIAQLFYESLCYHHNNKYLSCPSMFDLGTEGKLSVK